MGNAPKRISFANYKAFGETEEQIDIRPITVVVGKNNSGKSSLLKLISVFKELMSGNAAYPLLFKTEEVELGGGYEDLFHNKETSLLKLGIQYQNGVSISSSFSMEKGIPFMHDYHVLNPERTIPTGKTGAGTAGVLPLEGYEPKGFTGNGLINRHSLDIVHIDAATLRFNSSYIGPVRFSPKRSIDIPQCKYESVGKTGDYAYPILLNSYLTDNVLFKKVSTWFQENLGGIRLDFVRNSDVSGSYSLCVVKNGVNINIADVGQGISQLLPIVVASFMDNDMAIVCIEQPALHMHPAAHATVARRLAESALEKGRSYVIESHSENIILGLREMISDRNNPLQPSDVIIYFIDNDDNEATIERITIDHNGELSSWPDGVFSENYDLLEQIMEHSRR